VGLCGHWRRRVFHAMPAAVLGQWMARGGAAARRAATRKAARKAAHGTLAFPGVATRPGRSAAPIMCLRPHTGPPLAPPRVPPAPPLAAEPCLAPMVHVSRRR
jgi:hypothetical protein